MNASTILLGYGANLAGPWGPPEVTIAEALRRLEARGVHVRAVSRLYVTPPFGPVPQPDYLNGAAVAETALAPVELLRVLKQLEREAGRTEGVRWGPRPLDIDILAYDGVVQGWDVAQDAAAPTQLILPHPGLHQRDFVLRPLAEVAPDWRHPVMGLTVREMLAALPGGGEGLKLHETTPPRP